MGIASYEDTERLVERIASYALGHPLRTPRKAPLQLISLVCHRDILYYLSAVRAFIAASGLQCSVWMISDGTVTTSDRHLLASELPDAHFRAMEGDQLEDLPAGLTSLRRFVAEHPLGRKLVGVLRYAQAPNLILLDSDVLFLRRPDAIVEWTRSSDSYTLFGRDTRFDSCALDLESQPTLKSSATHYFNSGLLCVRIASLDVALAERVISRLYSIDARSKWLWEQTAFAAMVGKGRRRALPDDYLFVNDVNVHRKLDLIQLSAVHYSGPARRRFFTEGLNFLISRKPGTPSNKVAFICLS